MAKEAVTDYSTTPASNTDIGGVGIQGSNQRLNFDDALRELMAQLAETNAGTSPWADTMTIGNSGDLTRKGRFSMASVSAGTTRVYTMPNYNGTLATLAGTETLSAKTFSDSTKFAAGAVGAPSVALSTNTDTGFYFPNTAAGAWTLDGVEYVRYADTGTHYGKTAGAIGTAGISLYYDATNKGLIQATRSAGISLQLNRLTSDGTLAEFMTTGTVRGSISISGSTTSYNTTSDKNLKTNLRHFNAGDIIDAIDAWLFDWKSGGSGYGVIAQDCLKAFPDAVTRGQAETPWQVDYSKFVPLLLAEIKALRQRVSVLEKFPDDS